jgi:hypothetical protein
VQPYTKDARNIANPEGKETKQRPCGFRSARSTITKRVAYFLDLNACLAGVIDKLNEIFSVPGWGEVHEVQDLASKSDKTAVVIANLIAQQKASQPIHCPAGEDAQSRTIVAASIDIAGGEGDLNLVKVGDELVHNRGRHG